MVPNLAIEPIARSTDVIAITSRRRGCGTLPRMSNPSASRAGRGRRLVTAELFAVGTELLVGETLDTNSRELATRLTADGVRVLGIRALPDDQVAIRDAVGDALERADLVVSTGGLGPTPDDTTREAIAELVGEEPRPDPALEAWLRELFARRGAPFAERNLKQAWLIPSAIALQNPNGTAPGWWIDRPDGRVVVMLPGPPREMLPMWDAEVEPRLAERSVGRPTAVQTLRLTGIGESQVAELIGDELLRSTNPAVATYARADGVDVRISAVVEHDDRGEGRAAAEASVRSIEERVLGVLGRHVWARGTTTWSDAIAEALAARDWRLATSERGTAGALAALLAGTSSLVLAEVLPAAVEDAGRDPDEEALTAAARAVMARAGASIGLALDARGHGGDTRLHIAVVTPEGTRTASQLAFLAGPNGRARAAIAAAAVLLEAVRPVSVGTSRGDPDSR